MATSTVPVQFVGVKFTADQLADLDRLDQLAAERATTRSAMIREAVRAFVERENTAA